MLIVLEITRPSAWTYQGRGTTVNSACYSEMLTDSLSLQFEANAYNYCQKVLCRCMTMPTLLKPSGNSSLM
jgi:hypothetical protein